MGQYYRAITINKNDEMTVYNRNVGGRRTMAKIMEHSWWDNTFVGCITKLLYHNPLKVAWVGDYAIDDENFAKKRPECASILNDIHAKTWNDGVDAIGITRDELLLNGKYLVNHTFKTYVNCDTYYNASYFKDREYGWAVHPIHPIPLLTAIGNGQGGGDYWGVNQDDVGTWALCEISVEDEAPNDYTEVTFSFHE